MDACINTLKILVLDDEQFMLNLIVRLLSTLGVRTIKRSTDARAALGSLGQDPEAFDVIIADLNMPGMDGIELIRHLAAIRFQGHLVIISGEDIRVLESARLLAERHHLKVLGILPKPVKAKALGQLLAATRQERAKETITGGSPSDRVEQDEMGRAIDHHELLLHYQPKVRLGTGRCDAAEGLLRWEHPSLNLLPPSCFIRHVEEGPYAQRITEMIYRLALEQHLGWYARGYRLRVAVNLPVMILDDVQFADRLVSMASEAGVDSESICFEITETGVIENLNAASDILTRLRLKGFGIAIDDFGTGHSSLAQLRDIPFSELKIDRSFVTGSANNESWLAITESSVELAKKLGMTVVAEGVETEEELAFVRDLGCDYAQGYLFSKPLHPNDLETWMDHREGRHAGGASSIVNPGQGEAHTALAGALARHRG